MVKHLNRKQFQLSNRKINFKHLWLKSLKKHLSYTQGGQTIIVWSPQIANTPILRNSENVYTFWAKIAKERKVDA